MKNKNEVTGNLLLGCTVLRITPEVLGGVTILLLEHAAGMPGYRFLLSEGVGGHGCQLWQVRQLQVQEVK